MARRTPQLTVSAVVSPATWEEIDRLATASGVSRSQMVRQILEEKLTERANARLEDEYGKLEKRLAKIEERFAALLVKVGRAAAQGLWLQMKDLEFSFDEDDEESDQALKDLWKRSQEFAGKWLESPAKKKGE